MKLEPVPAHSLTRRASFRAGLADDHPTIYTLLVLGVCVCGTRAALASCCCLTAGVASDTCDVLYPSGAASVTRKIGLRPQCCCRILVAPLPPRGHWPESLAGERLSSI